MDFFAAFCLFFCFFAGMGFAFVLQYLINRKALSIVRTQANAKGRLAQQEQESDLMALIAEAAAAFKEAKERGEPLKETAMRVLPALALKYPGVSLKFGKKLFSALGGKGLEGLEEFL